MADEFEFRQVHNRRFAFISHRRQVIAAGMTSSAIVPVGPDSQDVIQVLLAAHAKTVQHLVLERLESSLKRLNLNVIDEHGYWRYQSGQIGPLASADLLADPNRGGLSSVRGPERRVKIPASFKQLCDSLAAPENTDVRGVVFESESL